MGFNRRKMEDQRREAAEKEAATRRATDAISAKGSAKFALMITPIVKSSCK